MALESLILVSGMSGAGRSSVQRVLSDLGYYAVDNLPLELLNDFLKFIEDSQPRYSKISLHVDLATKADRDTFLTAFETLRQANRTRLIFVDSNTGTILNRYNESRRPHPGFDPDRDNTLEDTIKRERSRYVGVSEKADFQLDTSDMNIHALKRRVKEFIDSIDTSTERKLRVNFLSFGFKRGMPRNCDLLVDVRFLPNPYFVESLREQTGLDLAVQEYVLEQDAAKEFLTKYDDLLRFLLPLYIHEGKAYINIGIGCTGGQHRSVSIAEHFAKTFVLDGVKVSSEHRDL